MGKTTDTLRERARQLLSSGAVKVVIGYAEREDGETTPAFVRREEDCDTLVFNRRCFVNLTKYLTKPEVRALGRAAIVSKGCDNRALNILIREQRVKREEIHILGVECPGMDKGICAWCDQHAPADCDELIESSRSAANPRHRPDPTEGMTTEERWQYWMSEFSRCIRCYACRQVCPMCHCTRCMAEKNQPQWIDSSPTPRGNMMWNMMRAFHLAGRCVECGECERACPMDIPLNDLSRTMRETLRDSYGDVPGRDAQTPSPLAQWKETDQEEFFR